MDIKNRFFPILRNFNQLNLLLTSVINLSFTFLSLSDSITELSGEQSGEYIIGEYIVTDNVIIPEGKTMTIQAGSVIRFKQYTGLIVKGKLECIGNADTVTLFTSEKIQSVSDTGSYNQNLSQWNGVEIISGGSVHAEYIGINNSVFGIKSEKKFKSILLEKVVFSNNVQNFSIADKIIHVENDSEFDFPNVEENETAVTQPAVKKDTIVIKEVKEIKVMQKPPEKPSANLEVSTKKRWKTPVLLSFGTSAIAGGVLGIIYLNKYEDKKKEYNQSRDVKNTKKKREDEEFFLNLSITLIGISAAGTLGFSITAFF
jgi:hypothetical protein